MSEDSFIVITSAINTAFIDHPGSGHGNQAQQEKEKLINESPARLLTLAEGARRASLHSFGVQRKAADRRAQTH